MFSFKRSLIALVGFALVVGLVALFSPTSTRGQGGGNDGNLFGSGEFGNVEFVGRLDLTAAADLIGDVAASPDGNWAFLAGRGQADCSGDDKEKKSTGAGVWVIDISDPSNPQQGGFIPLTKGSLPGDVLQVVGITTTFFSGWALVVSNERCGKNGQGGFSLYDVTNPLKPYKLVEHFGAGGFNTTSDTGTAFAWDAGDRAYAAASDESRPTVVTIFDITNPMRPRPAAEYDLAEFGIAQPALMLNETSLQSITVKQIAGQFMMLLSAGDGGHVLIDVTDPAVAVFVGDTDYSAIDLELLESTGIALPPEGNAHYSEFTADNRFFIGTDEDLSSFRGSLFDGWGYVHLYDNRVFNNNAGLLEIDTYAIPEAHDEAFAVGFGNLSVHEVATHPTAWASAYLAYNAGGLRAIEIQCADPNIPGSCELVETGGYLGPQGNDFLGVEVFVKDGKTYILGSDRDRGLWIFRDTSLST